MCIRGLGHDVPSLALIPVQTIQGSPVLCDISSNDMEPDIKPGVASLVYLKVSDPGGWCYAEERSRLRYRQSPLTTVMSA